MITQTSPTFQEIPNPTSNPIAYWELIEATPDDFRLLTERFEQIEQIYAIKQRSLEVGKVYILGGLMDKLAATTAHGQLGKWREARGIGAGTWSNYVRLHKYLNEHGVEPFLNGNICCSAIYYLCKFEGEIFIHQEILAKLKKGEKIGFCDVKRLCDRNQSDPSTSSTPHGDRGSGRNSPPPTSSTPRFSNPTGAMPDWEPPPEVRGFRHDESGFTLIRARPETARFLGDYCRATGIPDVEVALEQFAEIIKVLGNNPLDSLKDLIDVKASHAKSR